MGQPHCWVLNSWLTVAPELLKTHLKAGAELDPDRKIVMGYTAKLQKLAEQSIGLALNMIGEEVLDARVVRCFDQASNTLQFKVADGGEAAKVMEVLYKLMMKEGGEPLPGVAPPGDLERKIQEAIEEAA